jgi:stage V sporulation protein S
MDTIKVSANSRTSAVAGAIAGVVREYKRAEVQAIGAGAVNQAIKALVLATGYLKNDGIDVCCVPEFVDVEIDQKVRTAIKLVIEPYHVPVEPGVD